MAKFRDWINPTGSRNPIWKGAQKFMGGTPEKRENVSTLRPEQEPLLEQLINSGINPGAGGVFGSAADYYRSLMDPSQEMMNEFSAPALRQYNEEIVPGLSEQFAGMGSGGLSSSGFRNAQVAGATDLSERLGALRANLRQAGAQGLMNIGSLGLGNFSQNMVTEPGTEGFMSSVAPAIGRAAPAIIGGIFGGPAGAAAGAAVGAAGANANVGSNGSYNWLKNSLGGQKVGVNTSPYQGGGGVSSPQIYNYQR